MDGHLPLIARSPLFRGIEPDRDRAMLGCLDVRQRHGT